MSGAYWIDSVNGNPFIELQGISRVQYRGIEYTFIYWFWNLVKGKYVNTEGISFFNAYSISLLWIPLCSLMRL